MQRLEKAIKITMLAVGVMGIVVIYSGFFFLQFNDDYGFTLPWYFLVSPWICVYFGLEQAQQTASVNWLVSRFKLKN
ncbi:hypothetical protein [Shewanella youngdeokensis]